MESVVRLLFVCLAMLLSAAGIAQARELTFSPTDRVLILSPHPDDEVLGCAGAIRAALAAGAKVKVCFFTYGDNNELSFLVYRKHPVLSSKGIERMGEVRRAEAVVADTHLGLQKDDLVFLGYPDFTTLEIWFSHWGDAAPAHGMLSHATAVPYADAFRPGAPFKGDEIVQDLTSVIADFKPTDIFVSHPGDYNSDHQALYLFTRVALWGMTGSESIRLHPYLIHYPGWPRPKGLHLGDALVAPPRFFIGTDQQLLSVSERDRTLKYEALRAHRSQFAYNPTYLSSFVRANEMFLLPEPIVFDVATDERQPPAPEELVETERMAYIGIQTSNIAVDTDTVTVVVSLTKPIAEATSFSMALCGYRDDVPFSMMPKIDVKCGALAHRVIDRGHAMPADTVAVSRKLGQMTLKISRRALGDPQRILVSAHTSFELIPFAWLPWQIVECRSVGGQSKEKSI